MSSSSSSSSSSDKLSCGSSGLHHESSSDEKSMELNSWIDIDGSTFQVRQPNYSTLRQKDSSSPALYECSSVDLYSIDKKIGHVGRVLDIPYKYLNDEEIKENYLPPIIVVNWSIPGYAVENAIWGKNPEDGNGYGLIFIYKQSQFTRDALKKRRERIKKQNEKSANNSKNNQNSNSKKNKKNKNKNNDNNENDNNNENTSDNENADNSSSDEKSENSRWLNDDDDDDVPSSIRLLHRFSHPDTDPELRLRFKCITRLINVDDCGLGKATKTLVQKYNNTPFLIRTTSVFYHGDHYFEIDVDVHRFSYLARLGLSGVRERIKDVVFDMAFVIEGVEEDELPEQILSAQRLSKLDLTSCKTFPEKNLPPEHHKDLDDENEEREDQ